MHSSHVECNAPLLYRRFLALCYSRAWVAPAFNSFHVVTGGPGSDVLSVLVSFTSLSLSYLTLPLEQIIQKYIKFLWNSARQGMLVGDTKQLWELPKPVTGPSVRNLNGNTASGICSGLLMNWYSQFCLWMGAVRGVASRFVSRCFHCFRLTCAGRLSFSTSPIH